MSSAGIMISKCEQNKNDYIVLFQDPLNGLNPLSRIFCVLDGSKKNDSTITDLTQEESESLHHFIFNGRMAIKLQDHHKYLIAYEWLNPVERERFNLFPEVLTVDTVAGTNNENRPLLIMGGKDSNGKLFIFLRTYLPHERGWIFL